MSLCWCSDTEESKTSLEVRVLLALDDFLFEDVPRCAGLLSIWANAGADNPIKKALRRRNAAARLLMAHRATHEARPKTRTAGES